MQSAFTTVRNANFPLNFSSSAPVIGVVSLPFPARRVVAPVPAFPNVSIPVPIARNVLFSQGAAGRPVAILGRTESVPKPFAIPGRNEPLPDSLEEDAMSILDSQLPESAAESAVEEPVLNQVPSSSAACAAPLRRQPTTTVEGKNAPPPCMAESISGQPTTPDETDQGSTDPNDDGGGPQTTTDPSICHNSGKKKEDVSKSTSAIVHAMTTFSSSFMQLEEQRVHSGYIPDARWLQC
ncbi:hypothetical protein R1sor_005796 [Riccia sorocarpa]|uniref:Uncharacterized protein n=1 Tax=Riccia sorocarpa TaxID=122646 RepID=A0ABD3HKJ3_9MARC